VQVLAVVVGGVLWCGVVWCGVVSAAPELDINKACGECKQRAEEVAMGVRGLCRTWTVGVGSDKNNNNGGPGRTERLLATLLLRVSGANERAGRGQPQDVKRRV
jgi:hypothetical protein